MRRLYAVILVAAFSLCLTTYGISQDKTFLQMPPKDPSTVQGVEGGVWRIDGNYEATLHVKNVLDNHALSVTPTVFMADGTAYDLPIINLEPSGTATVNIGTALLSLPANLAAHRSTYGMLGLKYHWSWPALLATIHDIDETGMVSFHNTLSADTTVTHSPSAQFSAQQIEGAWWRPFATTNGFLVISNTLLNPAQIEISVCDATGKMLSQRTLSLNAHATQRLELADFWSSPTPPGTTGSIIVRYSGPRRGILAFGGLEDATTGYSATFHLEELHPEQARDLTVHRVVVDGPGLMIGQQNPDMQFPQNTVFELYSVLHNTSNQARQVDLSITTGGSTSPQTQEIGLITLAPGATQQVDYDTMLSKLKTQPLNGFVDLSIGYTGHTGDVEIDEGSVDQSGNYVFEVSPQSEVWTISKTICHWSVLGDTNTMVSLWNYSSQAQDLTLTLHYSGGQYVLPVHLNPRADTELDIASLIRNGVPDQNGSVIPQSITEGSAVLSDAKDRRNKIYVASSTSTFNVRNGTCTVSCGTCDGFVSGIIQPQPLAIVVKGTGQATGEITYDYGTTYTQPASSANWSTSNGAIATVSTSGTGTGVAPGTANFEFIVDDLAIYEGYICMGESLECPYGNVGGQGPVNVALTPDHLLWFSDLTERSSACAIASQNATLRIIGYQAVTANNATAGPVAMKENFANISPLSTCSNPLPSPTPCVPVNGDGTFTDFITTNACAPPNPITCGYSISPDNWQYCGGITPVTIGQPNYSVLWRAVYVDGSTASVPLLTPVPK